MIFFVDLVRYHQPKRNILKWMEQLSEHNGTNIFQIPLIVLATNTHLFSEEELHKEKCKLQRELKDLLYPHQLIFVNWE